MPTIAETIDFITEAHAGQVDKDGTAYHLHPIAVMRRLPADIADEIKIAALLHDVLEDTPVTRDQLAAMGYSARTLDAVELVTIKRGDARTYADKIDALIVSGNRDAITIKYADMSENTDPQRLANLPPDLRQHFEKKYVAPKEALQRALEHFPSDVNRNGHRGIPTSAQVRLN